MKTILISLISDQTIPNLLAIDNFQPDELLFLTTEAMEKKQKFRAIMETLQLLGRAYPDCAVQKLVVQEDSILDCHHQLDRWIAGREGEDRYILNLTGGTKIMSIAAYEFFKDYGAKMLYIPIPKNEYIVPFPKKSSIRPEPLPLRLSVHQYLTAYGLKVTNVLKLDKYRQEAKVRSELATAIVAGYDELKPLLQFLGDRLRPYRDFPEYLLMLDYEAKNDRERDLLTRMVIDYDGRRINRKFTGHEIQFLTGGWLEEYCYNQTISLAGIDDATIGIKLMNRQGGDNEYDVMFTRGNKLYFIECKSLDQNDDKKTDALYKIGALQKEFGLRTESFLLTTSPHVLGKGGKLKETVRARAEQFNTTVLIGSDVANLAICLKERFQKND